MEIHWARLGAEHLVVSLDVLQPDRDNGEGVVTLVQGDADLPGDPLAFQDSLPDGVERPAVLVDKGCSAPVARQEVADAPRYACRLARGVARIDIDPYRTERGP